MSTIILSFLGAAIIGILDNGIVLLGINTFAQRLVVGSVILLADSLHMWQKKRCHVV